MTPSDERLIELYLDMLAAERGAAANTLQAYRRDLEDFSTDLAAHGGAIASAGSEDIRRYLGRLSGRSALPCLRCVHIIAPTCHSSSQNHGGADGGTRTRDPRLEVDNP